MWDRDPQSPLSIHGSETEMYLIHDAEYFYAELAGYERPRQPAAGRRVSLRFTFWFRLLKNGLGFAQERILE